ncbi:MAG TPA: protein translocase subunit SecF [Actinomycetota bacterium]|nr:protein translocase subunit SecF [Actinomycetota bacterium]
MNLRDALDTFRGHRVPDLPIIARSRTWFALSGVLLALSLIGLLWRGLNFSLEFEGGALLRYPDRTGVSAEEVRRLLADPRFGLGDAEVQIVNGDELSVRTRSLSGMDDRTRAELLEALARQAGTTVEDISRQDVGPTWGSEISRKALQGLLIFLVAVTAFISLRFEWKMAVGAQAALFHDLLITAGIYALVGREVTPATVIAILTILGYSLYDTVVIYDKVRENTASVALVARDTYAGVVNTSLNQVLMRSVNTSLSTLLPIVALLLFGGETLKDFAFALAVGVASGAYSSVFVAAPILALLKEREPRMRQLRARAGRPALRVLEGRGAVAAPAEGSVAARTPGGPAPARNRPKPRRRAPAKRKRR